MQRYDIWHDDYDGMIVVTDAHGEWVKWEDVKAAFPEYARLITAMEEAKVSCATDIERMQKQLQTSITCIEGLQKELDMLRKSEYASKYRVE